MSEIQEKNQLNPFLKYSGIAIQMAATIGIFTYGGYWLDGHYNNQKPIITLILMLLGTMISIYTLIRQLKS